MKNVTDRLISTQNVSEICFGLSLKVFSQFTSTWKRTSRGYSVENDSIIQKGKFFPIKKVMQFDAK